MASIITHVAIPLSMRLAAGKSKISGPLLFWAMAASILPDFDVIGFKLGIPYASPFGHRGFTHSILFAGFIALTGMLFHQYLKAAKRTVLLTLFFSVLSHALLDALTNGGLGVALFWPLSNARLFFSWTPIEVSPIGISRFISERGLAVLWSEVKVVWLPLMLVGISSNLIRRSRGVKKNTRKK